MPRLGKTSSRRTAGYGALLPVAPGATFGRSCPTPAIAQNWLGPLGGKRTDVHSEGGCYSMTSSARARIEGGTLRPRALAVLRLTTSSKVVGCWTGRSAGLAPLRILPA